MKKFIVKASKTSAASRQYVKAAEDDDGLFDEIDDVADSVEDLRDSVDDISEDSVDIAVNNNIEDHFIAECQSCHGVFISAVIQSDESVKSVTGICPLCSKETEQALKWVIKTVKDAEDMYRQDQIDEARAEADLEQLSEPESPEQGEEKEDLLGEV